LNDAKEALKGGDVAKIKETTEALMTASQRFAEVLYKNAQTQPDQAASSEGGADDVVDAEIVDEGGEEKSA
jgi:molecular chaperone DnaK